MTLRQEKGRAGEDAAADWLEKAGMLEIYDQSFQGRNRRYYHLTEAGAELLARQTAEWQQFKQDMDGLLEG